MTTIEQGKTGDGEHDSLALWPGSLPELILDGERLVQPQYAGWGLANVAPTTLRLLEASDGVTLPPLDESALPPRLLEGARSVVVLLADGLGHMQLVEEIRAGNAPNLARLIARADAGVEQSHYAVITSVFPTTTVAAVGSVNSGVLPSEHGLLGYTVYLEEFETVAEMIRWGPLDRAGSFTEQRHGGADARTFFWSPTIYQRMDRAGVKAAHVVNPLAYHRTPLSRMWHQGATYHGYVATSSLSVMVPRIVEGASGRCFVYAYWPTVDTVTHLRGPRSPEHGAEVAALDLAVGRLLDRLRHAGDTLFLLTADHGHIGTSVEEEVLLNDYLGVADLLAAPPAGERRATYLYARDGEGARLEEAAREALSDVAVVLGQAEAARLGLFGPGSLSSRAARRVGDVLLLPRGKHQIGFRLPDDVPPEERPSPAPPFCGLHGGLTPEEALVPLLAVRL